MKIISKNFIEEEMANIGFDTAYLKVGANKHRFLNIKIFNLRAVEANILKQSALSAGCDAAVHRHSIDCKVENTDCILSGTVSQLFKVVNKLKKQPFKLSKIAENLHEQIVLQGKTGTKPKIMGILNLTPNSFSDGGSFLELDNALKHVQLLIKEGADIIDIGAESTRPNALEINCEIEIARIIPILTFLKKNFPQIVKSVDTRHSKTANAALEAGADIINDVSGLTFDSEMIKILKKYNKKVVITHSRGIPENMENMCNYTNTIDEIYRELEYRCDFAVSNGIKKENIIADVGFGFAKNFEQNIELMKRIEEFKSLGYPILAGVSRKRFLQILAQVENPQDADNITAQTSAYFASKGINYIRVHNVKKTVEAIKFGSLFL